VRECWSVSGSAHFTDKHAERAVHCLNNLHIDLRLILIFFQAHEIHGILLFGTPVA